MKTIERNAVKLAYDDVGRGGPPLLFAHGATCDRSNFAAQVEHFRRTHRVVNVDLRGHGESSVPDSGYDPGELADDLAAVARELGLHKPVVVGHSLGGFAALALAARHPELPSAIVMLDSALFLPPPVAAQIAPIFEAVMRPAGMSAWIQFVEASFGALDESSRRSIQAQMARAPHAVLAQCLAGMLAFDVRAGLAATEVPSLFVGAGVPVDLDALRQAHPSALIEQVRAGHFLMMERPDEVNALLERFMRAV